MSPTNVTPRDGIGRPRTPVERRPFGPTIAEPAAALRLSAGRGAIDPAELRPPAPEAAAQPPHEPIGPPTLPLPAPETGSQQPGRPEGGTA